MFFRLQKYLIGASGVLACCVMLFRCSDNGGPGSELPDPPQSIGDQVREMVQGIAFVGTLPNGQTLNFSPANRFSDLGSVDYATVEGSNFSGPGNGIIIDASEFSGSGEMTLGANEYTFQFVWCTTLGDIRRRFPNEIRTNPDWDHWLVFIAIGQDNYSHREIISGTVFNVEDYLFISINPNDPISRTYEGVFIPKNDPSISLVGSYSIEGDGILSWGSAFLGYNHFIGGYSVRLRCGR